MTVLLRPPRNQAQMKHNGILQLEDCNLQIFFSVDIVTIRYQSPSTQLLKHDIHIKPKSYKLELLGELVI